MLNAVVLGLRRFRIEGRPILAAEVFADAVYWQAPPIQTGMSLLDEVGSFFGVPDLFPAVSEDTALKAYTLAMKYMGNGYEASDIAAALEVGEEAPLLFSQPEDWTAPEEAAACFGVEFVMFMSMTNGSVLNLGPSDCWTTVAGQDVGIRDSKVLGTPYTVESMDLVLTMPRGKSWETRTLNVIDRMAVWVDMNGGSLPPEMSGLRDVLTLLRFTANIEEMAWLENMLAVGLDRERLPALERAKRLGPKVRLGYRDNLVQAVRELNDTTITDSVRIFKMMNLLVPFVISQSTFNSMFLDMNQRKVKTLSLKSIERMRKNLSKLMDAYDSQK